MMTHDVSAHLITNLITQKQGLIYLIIMPKIYALQKSARHLTPYFLGRTGRKSDSRAITNYHNATELPSLYRKKKIIIILLTLE